MATRLHWARRLNLTWQLPERAGTDLPGPIVRAMEFTGLEIPLLTLAYEPTSVVLGNRRAAAVRGMKRFDDVPVYVAQEPEDIEAWCQADRATQRAEQALAPIPDHLPWTWRQRAAVLDYCLRGLDRTRGGPRGGSLAVILGEYFGVPEIQLRNAMYLLRFERTGGDEGARATEALTLVEASEIQPQSAYKKLRAGDPMQVGVAAPRPLASAAQQEKTLRSAGQALSGITFGLRQLGDIDPAMPAETRAELLGPLQEARTTLTRLARQLTSKGDEQV